MKQFIITALILIVGGLSAGYAQKASPILPKPQKVEFSQGEFKCLPSYLYYTKGVSRGLMDYFQEKSKDALPDARVSKTEGQAHILLINNRKSKDSEAYTLTVSPKQIRIEADGEKGVFYGIQSLLQLFREGKATSSIACQVVEDAPRFQWRAFMLDEGRYFKGEKEVLRLLDVMAELKMNVFHWHLTDDQGWRIEIKKYPKLTEIGSKREDTQIGGWNSEKRSGEPHGGFYTQRQIKSILAYAKERHIKVVPEIEMPGHATAAIAAYPWLGTKKEQIDVAVTFGKLYPVFNVIDPKVKQFLFDVVGEVLELFETDVIHIGGDEVRFNQWEEDPTVQAYKAEKGFSSYMDIQIEFVNTMSQFIAKKNASMMGWNEILGKNLHADDKIAFTAPSQKIAKNVIVHFWKGDLNEITRAAKEGYRLVNSYHGNTYLDYGYNSISLEKAYLFEPVPKGLPKEFEKNIYGLGCQMWSEWTPKVEDINRQVYPRIAAFAEVGWSGPEKDFKNFVGRLRQFLPNWKEKGIVWYPCPEIQQE